MRTAKLLSAGLRANSDKYGLDAERLGVWGVSAGGHLVALLGTAGDVKEFDKGQNLNVSSQVQAVCDYFGPTDLLAFAPSLNTDECDASNWPLAKLLGGPVQQNKEKAQLANPITYVSKDDPPFLIVHGDKDRLIPISQSQLLYDALKAAGVQVKFHTVKGAGHGFDSPQVDRMVDDVFDRHLEGSKTAS